MPDSLITEGVSYYMYRNLLLNRHVGFKYRPIVFKLIVLQKVFKILKYTIQYLLRQKHSLKKNITNIYAQTITSLCTFML